MKKAAFSLLAVAALVTGCSHGSEWPPETGTGLYHAAYAELKAEKERGGEDMRIRKQALAEARENLEMLETVLEVAVPGNSLGGLGQEDRLHLARIAVAYAATVLAHNRHNAYRVPGVLDRAKQLLNELGVDDHTKKLRRDMELIEEIAKSRSGFALKVSPGKRLSDLYDQIADVVIKIENGKLKKEECDKMPGYVKQLCQAEKYSIDKRESTLYIPPEYIFDYIGTKMFYSNDNYVNKTLDDAREYILSWVKGGDGDMRGDIVEYAVITNEKRMPGNTMHDIDYDEWVDGVEDGVNTFKKMNDSLFEIDDIGSSDIEYISRMFDKHIRIVENNLLNGQNKQMSLAEIDRNIDFLPNHRSFQRTIGEIKRKLSKDDNASLGRGTLVILVSASQFADKRINDVKETLLKYDMISINVVDRKVSSEKSKIFETINAYVESAKAESAKNNKEIRQILVIWGGHGESGKLLIGDDEKNFKNNEFYVSYQDLHDQMRKITGVNRILLLIDACLSGSAIDSAEESRINKGDKSETDKMIVGITAEADRNQLIFNRQSMLVYVNKYLTKMLEERVGFDHIDLYNALRDYFDSGLDDNLRPNTDRAPSQQMVGAGVGIYQLTVDGTFPIQRFQFYPRQNQVKEGAR